MANRRVGADRVLVIVWRPEGRVEFQVGLESRKVAARQGTAAADASTMIGEAPKTMLEWRSSLVITGMQTPAANAAALASRSDVDKLCQDVRTVVASGRDDFATIKKAKIDDDTWSTEIRLHGFSNCDISALSSKSSYYSCHSKPVDSLSQLRADQDALAAALSTCLGSEWRMTRRARGDGLWNVELAEPTDRVSAEVRARRRRTGDLYLVLDINSNAP